MRTTLSGRMGDSRHPRNRYAWCSRRSSTTREWSAPLEWRGGHGARTTRRREGRGDARRRKRPPHVFSVLYVFSESRQRVAFLRRRDACFDEAVPLVAVRAVPQQLGAAIAAPHADVRIEIEDR